MKTNKRLCVLQVTPEHPNLNHVELFKDKKECDFYFVTHDKTHDDALKFCPNTKWADTRNILAAEVPKKYDYYAFIDYDYVLRPQKALNALDQILEDLESFEPAVLTYYPGKGLETPYAHDEEYKNSRDYSCIPFTHSGLKIVHHSLMNWFFPMTTNFSSDIDSCHLFNIQEIPFLKHIVCSHKMLYDNGYSDENAAYNKDGTFTKYKMDEMWKWIRPAFKQTKLIDSYTFKEAEKKDSLIIKNSLVKIFKNKDARPLSSPKNVNYLNLEKLNQFFDLSHEHFQNLDLDVSQKYSDIDNTVRNKIEECLATNVSFDRLKNRKNPWQLITQQINDHLDFRDITNNECVEIFQKMPNNKSLFYKNCKLDKKLSEYLEDKIVAFVGPSPYLKGSNKGKEIDSCDVIVRIQHNINNPDDYGSRTDIIQSCLNDNYGPPVVEYCKDVSEEKKPKFIICNDTVSALKNFSSAPDNDDSWLYVDEIYQELFSDLDIHLIHLKNNDNTWDRWPLYWEIYAKEHIEKVGNGYSTFSANFNSGYGALNFLLRYPIKELRVYGIDFYNMAYPQSIEEKYNKDYIATYGRNGRHHGPDKLLHDQLSQMMHCRNVLMKDKRFILDNKIAEKLLSGMVTARIEKFKKLPKFKNETR